MLAIPPTGQAFSADSGFECTGGSYIKTPWSLLQINPFPNMVNSSHLQLLPSDKGKQHCQVPRSRWGQITSQKTSNSKIYGHMVLHCTLKQQSYTMQEIRILYLLHSFAHGNLRINSTQLMNVRLQVFHDFPTQLFHFLIDFPRKGMSV